MKFTFVTLFDNLVKFYFQDSILKKAIENSIISVEYINPRDFASNRHKKVDAPLCGGGAGQLMTPQPLFDTLNSIKKKNPKAYIVFPLASAKPFKQNDAKRLASKEHIVFVSGRYEGIDERVIEKYANEVFSIGDYILTGGELPSLVMSDAISRNIESVLGNSDSLSEESYNNYLLEAPSFTKPVEFDNLSVSSELLKGNHSKMSDLKRALSILKTKYYRPKNLEKFRIRKNYEK